MAVNPNTDFSSSAVLTAAQQNRFPRGVMAYAETTSLGSYGTAEAVTITATSFTAVANRYYRFTYFEPVIQLPSGTSTYCEQRIRLTNAAGAQYAFGQQQSQSATQVSNTNMIQTVAGLSAGTYTFVGTMKSSTGSPALYRSGFKAFILIEDIGPS
jgi:hypothetical protein